jgi:hypothetical protein
MFGIINPFRRERLELQCRGGFVQAGAAATKSAALRSGAIAGRGAAAAVRNARDDHHRRRI